jgi:1-acyl-sn-glycerol-3-phosphate acyltransferase
MTDAPGRPRTGTRRSRPPAARKAAPAASRKPSVTGRASSSLNGHVGRGDDRARANGVPWLAPAPDPQSPPKAVMAGQPDVWDERVAGALRFLRRRITGQYDVDEFGFDPDLTEAVVHPLLRLMYRYYFRVDALGVENLPDGSALIVANHSGTLPVDALMLTMAVHDESPDRRHLRLLGADLVFRLPVLSEVARKAGSTLACNRDAERLLHNGEYVGVFPEGFKGIGKPYRERYKLQRFGRGGFVAAALRTGAPIVPVAIVGAEEIYPIIANIKPLAKVTGLPYVPVTPLFPWLGPLGALPLPSKWFIQFGKPIDTATLTEDADDPIVVFNLADQVRETIQENIHELLERRPDPFT